MASAQAETMRMVRAASAVLYLTFLIPVCAISESMIAAGKAYAAENKGKKLKNRLSPCHAKWWCSMVVSLHAMAKEHIAGLAKKPDEMQDAVDVLNNHIGEIKRPEDLICHQLHCESRITYASDKCVLRLLLCTILPW